MRLAIAISVAVLAGTGCGESDLCLEGLKTRGDGTRALCLGLERCSQLEREGERVVSFSVDIDVQGASEAERDERVSRVADYLRCKGAGPVVPSPSGTDLVVTGSWLQVESVRTLSVVSGIWPGCHTEDVCRECAAHSEVQCRRDYFCRPFDASRLDPTTICLDRPQYLGCDRADVPCGEAYTWFKPPDGSACWKFGTACAPSGWIAGSPGCEDAAMDQVDLPPCPARP
jgi:hypothetical protein